MVAHHIENSLLCIVGCTTICIILSVSLCRWHILYHLLKQASIHEENSINNRVQSFGPRVCNSNAYDLPVFYHGIEHEYGAASRRKVSSTDMLSISLNASTFNSIIAPQTEDGTIRTGVFHTLQGSIALVYSQYVENAVNTKYVPILIKGNKTLFIFFSWMTSSLVPN